MLESGSWRRAILLSKSDKKFASVYSSDKWPNPVSRSVGGILRAQSSLCRPAQHRLPLMLCSGTRRFILLSPAWR